MKTSAAERTRNRVVRSQLRAALKDLRNETNREEADKKYRIVASLVDKAARKHVVHKGAADRQKSRLARFVRKLDK